MEDGKAMINIIYEDNHLLVVEKPINIPVQQDSSNDKDLLTLLKEYLKEKYKKEGNVYPSRLSKQVQNHEFKKTYLAVVQGKINKEGNFIDKLLKNHHTNTTTVSDQGKIAKLSYELVEYKDNLSLVKINLETGRSHQIRVQFSYHGYPLYGDQRYNQDTPKDQIALFAYQLEFTHPTTKEKLTFTLPKPERYPFNKFSL